MKGGEPIARMPRAVLALSADGALVVVPSGSERGRRAGGAPPALEVRELGGRLVRALPAGASSELAWSGRTLALVAPGSDRRALRTVLADLDDASRDVVIEGLGGAVLALDRESGRFLVGGAGGVAICAIGRQVEQWDGVDAPFAILPGGAGALVWVGQRLERVELATRARAGIGTWRPTPSRR